MTKTLRTCVAFLLLCSSMLLISEKGVSSANGAAEKVRHRVTYIFDENQDQVIVRTTRISFDTGLKKVNEYNFTDEAILPSHYRFYYTNGFNQQDGVVVNTPQGLKAYTIAQQQNLQGKGGVIIIYEFDYETLSLRKVTELKQGTRVFLKAELGMYFVYPDKGTAQYYSLVDNRRMLSGGHLLTWEDVAETEYSLSPAPTSQSFGVYCPNNKFTSCYNVEFGGEKGSSVKVTENKIAYDPKTMTSTKSFMAGGSKIKWKKTYNNKTSQWNVEGIRSGKSVLLYKGVAKELQTFVSPGGKYLVIIANPSGGVNKTQAGTVYIYDLKTLKQVQKYNTKYKAYVTGIRWLTDELYVIEYYFSNPGAYPPSAYYITEGKHFKIEYSQYRDWVNYWDSFSYDDMFYLTIPVAITSGDGVVHYNGQPAFHMNGLYYVPLKEFTDAFHIQYEVKGRQYQFERNGRTSKLAVSQSKQLVVDGKVYLPFGQWNKDLGLKVAQVNRHTMNITLLISDEMRKTDAAIKPEPQAYQPVVILLQRSGGGFTGLEGEIETPLKRSESNSAGYMGVLVALNHDRSLSITMPNKDMPVTITSRDYSQVLLELPVDKSSRKQIRTEVLPNHVFDEGFLTVVLPGDDTLVGFTLKLPTFDKNRF